jgi:two-component SAPR family response regulator
MIIVEDEAIISLMIESLADDLGWAVGGTASNEAEAKLLLECCMPSVAVLDINLGASSTSLSVAAICRERGVPVLFITAYTAAPLPAACGDAPILAKPFSTEDFEAALGRCVRVPADAE